MDKITLALFTLVYIASAQQFLPKVSDYLPVNDLWGKDIARSGRDTFWKVQKDEAATIISAYPVIPNAMTKVTFHMQIGDFFNIGCGQKDATALK